MRPLVSIIVPVYNREKFLDECIRSLLNQTYNNIEILLIDDESTDSSRDICKHYSKRDSRVKFFPMKHCGVSGARNKGLDESQGEYIMFCDSDDIVEKTWVETFINKIDEDTILVASGFEVLETGEKIFSKEEVTCIDISEFLEYRKKWRLYSVCMCCFRKTDRRFLTSISKGEDSLFVLEYIDSKKSGCLKYIPDALYKYRQNSNMSLFAFGKRDRISYEANIDCLNRLKARWGCSESVWNQQMSAIENEWFTEEVTNATFSELKKLMKDKRWNNYLDHLYGGIYEKIARTNSPLLVIVYLKYKKLLQGITGKKLKFR